MKKTLITIVAGMVAGAYLAHNYEDELDFYCHKAVRSRRKLMKKINHLDM